MTKANSQIGKIFTELFDSQGEATDIASPIFYVDKSQLIKPTLQTSGTLDGGIANLQMLQQPFTEQSADNSATSTDWQNTDDILTDNSSSTIDYSRRPHRLKLTNAGASADYSASITYNL